MEMFEIIWMEAGSVDPKVLVGRFFLKLLTAKLSRRATTSTDSKPSI
jgi:hypothetical protein